MCSFRIPILICRSAIGLRTVYSIFFLTVGLELKQELTTGSLANPKAAAVPMLCAVGGMITPPILFLATTALFSQFGPGEPGSLILTTTGSSIPFAEMSHGWAVPTATDIAFSLAVLALFAKALPGSIRAFLMTWPRSTICWPSS